MKDKKTRWQLAQKYEFNWWKKRENVINPDYYIESASEIRSYYSDYKELSPETCILEIGSGAAGILTFLSESKQRFAIDPLEYFYATVPSFTGIRDNSVQYFTAKGEELPFENNKFDVVIIDNVLDHCENPYKVMDEVKRTLKTNGFVYFRQNTYSRYGKFARFVMELFLVDKGHPFTFRKNELYKLFNLKGFVIKKVEQDGYFKTWKREITSFSLKDKIKALLFITRDKVTFFIQNVS